MNNVKNLKNKIKKLSRYLLNDILEYRKEILKSYNPFYLVAYKNLENIFQDIKQINFYKTKQQFYNDFYIKYFNKFYSNALIKPIIPICFKYKLVSTLNNNNLNKI